MEPDLTGDTGNGVNIEEASASIAADLGFGSSEPQADEGNESPELADVPHETIAPVEEQDPMPQSWAKGREELWKQTPAAVREQIKAREKQMLDGLDQYKEHNEFGRKVREIATPYKQYLQQQGVTEEQAFSYLLSAQHRLATGTPEQKVQLLGDLARSVGLDLSKIAGNGQNQTENSTNPEIAPLLQEINGIKSELNARKQADQHQFQKKVAQDVESFASDPKNAYFDECANETAKLIQAGYGLQEAYEKAVWANPVTRAKEIARIQTEAAENLKAKSKVEVQKVAKATSSNVRSRDTGKALTEPLGSWDDTMKATLAEMKARTH